MTPVWGLKEHVVPFVLAQMGEGGRDFGRCQTMAVMGRDGEMVAGIVFHNWNPRTGVIEVSAAATDPRWAQRQVLGTAMDYVYNTAGCQMVVARTHESNVSVRKLWKAMGASEYLIPRLRGRDASEAILTVTKEAWAGCRLARRSHGKAGCT